MVPQFMELMIGKRLAEHANRGSRLGHQRMCRLPVALFLSVECVVVVVVVDR